MINFDFRLYVLVHYNTSSLEAEAGGLPVGGQPGLHTVRLSQNKQTKTPEHAHKRPVTNFIGF